MFYLFLIFHILIFIESYFLFKKRLRKKSLYLFILNLILLIINIVKMLPTISSGIKYSSVIYIISQFKNHAITSIFWLLLNLAFFGITYLIIRFANKRKKQNTLLKILIYIAMIGLSLFFMITLFHRISATLLLISIIGIIALLVKSFIKEKKNYTLAAILLLIVFTVYSYGFYTGAARLQIALTGYPVTAYNTGLEELKFYKEENVKKYMPIEDIPTDEESVGMIQVRNYFGIKMGTYYNY